MWSQTMDPYSNIGLTRGAQYKDFKDFDTFKSQDKRIINPKTLNALLEIIEFWGLGLKVVDNLKSRSTII